MSTGTQILLGVVLALVVFAVVRGLSRRPAPPPPVPATGDLEATHLRRVRFSIAFRGYRMSEVDALLTRLAAQLEAHRAWQDGAGAEAGRPSQARPEDDVPPG